MKSNQDKLFGDFGHYTILKGILDGVFWYFSIIVYIKNQAIHLYFQCLSRSTAVEIVNSSKVLQEETRMLLDGKLLVRLTLQFLPSVYCLVCSNLPRKDIYLSTHNSPLCRRTNTMHHCKNHDMKTNHLLSALLFICFQYL